MTYVVGCLLNVQVMIDDDKVVSKEPA